MVKRKIRSLFHDVVLFLSDGNMIFLASTRLLVQSLVFTPLGNICALPTCHSSVSSQDSIESDLHSRGRDIESAKRRRVRGFCESRIALERVM